MGDHSIPKGQRVTNGTGQGLIALNRRWSAADTRDSKVGA